MPDTFDFSNYYGVDPWGDITLNERDWYDPFLRDIYLRNSVYSQHVSMKVDLNGPRARTIHFNDLIAPRPNIAPIQPRAMEATRLYTDSYQKSVTTQRYGNGMALHKESEMFSYWQRMGGGTGFGLLPIIQASLGQVITDHLDTLARNAFFAHPYSLKGLSTASGFDGIDTDDKMVTDLLDEIWLGMRDRSIPFAPVPTVAPSGSELLCITTAGAVHDLKREIGSGGALSFVEVHKYANATPLIRGELGMYRGFRFIDNPFAKLWNMGTNQAQTTITAAIQPGDGAADPETELVEGVRRVGQPGATHFIQVASVTGFEAGDMITIHELRHANLASVQAYKGAGVVNGPKFDDPMLQNVEIHSVDVGNNRLILKEPYMMTKDNGKGLETDLGSGVYGYVTKAQTIHSALFLNPRYGVSPLVAGVAQPPVIYTPPAIDDYLSMYRITYDMWLKYALWEPRAFEVAFITGANRGLGRLFR